MSLEEEMLETLEQMDAASIRLAQIRSRLDEIEDDLCNKSGII